MHLNGMNPYAYHQKGSITAKVGIFLTSKLTNCKCLCRAFLGIRTSMKAHFVADFTLNKKIVGHYFKFSHNQEL